MRIVDTLFGSIWRSLISGVICIAACAALLTATLSFAFGGGDEGRSKAMETTGSVTIVTGEYGGFGLSQVPNFVKSVAVGLSEGAKINDKAAKDSGIFPDQEKATGEGPTR